jgi:hypothetical protein
MVSMLGQRADDNANEHSSRVYLNGIRERRPLPEKMDRKSVGIRLAVRDEE